LKLIKILLTLFISILLFTNCSNNKEIINTNIKFNNETSALINDIDVENILKSFYIASVEHYEKIINTHKRNLHLDDLRLKESDVRYINWKIFREKSLDFDLYENISQLELDIINIYMDFFKIEYIFSDMALNTPINIDFSNGDYDVGNMKIVYDENLQINLNNYISHLKYLRDKYFIDNLD
jgi:hypothetical protein